MSDKILLGSDATALIEAVLDKVDRAVTSTMGPDGQVALIGSGDSSWTTKDGVTVAKSLRFDSPEEEIVNRIISEPAIKTDDECGDGTTTTIKLMTIIYRLLREDNSFKARKRVERIVGMLIGALQKQATFVKLEDELLYRVALTTSNQDEDLANKVMEIYRGCEKGYPDVEIKPGRGAGDLVERIDGRVVNMYLADQWFAGDNNANKVKLDRYVPVIVDDRILRASPEDLYQGIMNIRNQLGDDLDGAGNPYKTPIVLVVRSIEKDPINLISNLVINNEILNKFNRGRQPGVIVAMTNLGGGLGAAEMQDIGSVLGAPYANGLEALKSVQVQARTAPLVIGVSRSSIHDLSAEDVARIDVRIGAIEEEIAGYSYADRFTTRARINERRIRRLRGEVVTILVGGETNQEIKERVDRYQDVVKAVRSALENGVLPGCGMGLINAARLVDRALGLPEEKRIARVIGLGVYTQLMAKHLPENFEVSDIQLELPIINIATGDEMDASDLNSLAVWDTAYATITALKGGFQTAQILATASSVFNTSKLHGRSVVTGH